MCRIEDLWVHKMQHKYLGGMKVLQWVVCEPARPIILEKLKYPYPPFPALVSVAYGKSLCNPAIYSSYVICKIKMPKEDFLRNQSILAMLFRQPVFQGKSIEIWTTARRINIYGRSTTWLNPIWEFSVLCQYKCLLPSVRVGFKGCIPWRENATANSWS